MAKKIYKQLDELITEAIVDGFYRGLESFVEEAEQDIVNLMKIEEAGGIEGAIESIFEQKNLLRKLLR